MSQIYLLISLTFPKAPHMVVVDVRLNAVRYVIYKTVTYNIGAKKHAAVGRN